MLLLGCSVLYNSLPGNTEIQDIHQSRGLGINGFGQVSTE